MTLTFFTAGNVFTGVTWDSDPNTGVLVDGACIEWVGSAADLEAQRRDRTIEHIDFGASSTILPGLIDTHVHLSFDGGEDPVSTVRSSSTAQQLVTMLKSARELLSAGITTARDLGAPNRLDTVVRDAIEQGSARGPRMLTVGAPLTVTGGHCWFLGGECDSDDGARLLVRQAHKAGADHIKVMATGGVMTAGSRPWLAQFTLRELEVIVEEAHRMGMLVAAHGHGTEGIELAAAAGVDSIEHFSFTDPSGIMHEDDEVIDAVIDRDIFVCKTLSAAWTDRMQPPGQYPKDMLRKLADRGVKLVAGTDAGITNTNHREYVTGLEGMSWFGLTNREVLDAATASAAVSLGIDGITGTLTEGKAADFMVVEGNPVKRLADLRNVTMVVARGNQYLPEFRATTTWQTVRGVEE